MIFLREPLTHLVEKKSEILPEQKAMFFLESFFELFEIILSYLTNSISFLRVGAFAISHAAMMGVVMLFAGAHSGDPNILVVILGNIFVAGMEGLIVGIQVLRLEYYEMFSRFYKGTGKGFKPYKSK
jgi:V/A-type H+-transporting ATPase subunit I